MAEARILFRYGATRRARPYGRHLDPPLIATPEFHGSPSQNRSLRADGRVAGRVTRIRRGGHPQIPQNRGEGFWVAQGGERLSWEARRALGHFAGIGDPAE